MLRGLSQAATLSLLVGASAFVASCDTPPGARAFQATDRVQLVGGPDAIGEIGDFVIENDRIRAVILQGGNSVGPGMFGGTLVDADILRPETAASAGRGNDQFTELFPMVNLITPGYQNEGGPGIGDLDVQIMSDGTDGRCPLSAEEAPDGCAAIRVAGQGDRYIEALAAFELMRVEMEVSFITYFIVRPGDPFITVRTFFWDHNLWWIPEDLEGTAEEPAELARLAAQRPMDPLVEEAPIYDGLIGDVLAEEPPECTDGPCYRHPGYLAGDYLMLGKDLHAFGTSTMSAGEDADRSGFEFGYLFQRRYDRGEVVLDMPIADDLILGVGDRVSYGYVSGQGRVVVPVFTSSFSGAFTHSYQCVTNTPDEDCNEDLRQPMMYDRYIVIGEGDAASVLDAYYDLRETPTGRLTGHVFDEVTGQPIPHSSVFALLDPRVQADGTVDESMELTDYDSLTAAIRARWDRDAGVVSYAATDRGIDHVPDASWSMRLEPGRYFLVSFVQGRRPGRPVPVVVEEGSRQDLSLALPPAGRLNFEIMDDRSEHVASKLTVIGPLGDDAECPSDLPIPDQSKLRYLELGSSERSHGVAKVLYSQHGEGTIELAPGRYDVIASRGFEYSIDRRCVEVRQDTAPIEHFSVLREVDTTGWVAGDFHVHGVNSFDGSMEHDARIISAVAEGLEVFATTDHDYITNLEPMVYDLGMRDEVSTMVGIEVTPIETGHLLGYPLRFDETVVDNGGIDWTRQDRCLEDPTAFGCAEAASGFLNLTPEEMFWEIRELGEFGPDHTVVTVPHPRDGFFGYFDQFHLNQFDLVLEPAGIVAGQQPLLAEFEVDSVRFRLYSENFDAVEIFNGRRYEMIRTPTVGEVTTFVQDLAAAREEAGDERDYARRMAAAHEASVRRVLVRTPEEQALFRMTRRLGCVDHDDCAAGEVCDLHRHECTPEAATCSEDADCTEACIERRRCSTSGDVCTTEEDCAGAGETCDAATECATLATPCSDTEDCQLTCDGGVCQAAAYPCTTDDDCPGRWEYRCGDGGTCEPSYPSCNSLMLPCPSGYYCQSGVFQGQTGGRCLPECETDDDCHVDEYCWGEAGQGRFCRLSSCNIDENAGVVPEGERREGDDRPCVRNREPLSEGVVDDWFRLLNYGVAYTAMGNSDTHTLSTEIGLPRNFVMSSADAPAQISRLELADNIRAFHVVSSYGPFIEVSAEGGVIGDVVAADGDVDLRVRVQSASWFDVDRIEVYGNGELICDMGVASTEASRCETDGELAVGPDGHNTDIVNFDGVIRHAPAQDTWYVIIAMGVGDEARGLAPVYFSTLHPNLGISEVIGQAFASFEVELLQAVVPPPVQRAELNPMIPYAVTNPIWVEVDGDGVFTPPLGIPSYTRDVPCQFTRDQPEGCIDAEVFPLSSESIGRSPLMVEPEEDPAMRRARRVQRIQRALLRLAGGGC